MGTDARPPRIGAGTLWIKPGRDIRHHPPPSVTHSASVEGVQESFPLSEACVTRSRVSAGRRDGEVYKRDVPTIFSHPCNEP